MITSPRDHEEALVEELAGVARRCRRCRADVLVGVQDRQPELAAVAEVGLDGVGEEGHGHDDLVEPVTLQQAETCSIIGRLAIGSIGFGRVRGERPQTGAFAAGHDDGLHEPAPFRRRAAPTLAEVLSHHGDVPERRVVADEQAGDAERPAEPLEDGVAREVAAAPSKNAGNANMSTERARLARAT